MSRTAADLPEDPAELRRFAEALAAEVHAKTLLIEKLKMQLAMLRRARFGRSSEKLDRDIEQLELLIGDMEESDAERQARSEAVDSGASSSTPKKKPSVRAPLPDHLPLETIAPRRALRLPDLRREQIRPDRRRRARRAGIRRLALQARGACAAEDELPRLRDDRSGDHANVADRERTARAGVARPCDRLQILRSSSACIVSPTFMRAKA